MNKYPDYIMENVRQNLGLKKDDTSKDDIIMELPKEEVFNKCCRWSGIDGYMIWDIIKDIENTVCDNII